MLANPWRRNESDYAELRRNFAPPGKGLSLWEKCCFHAERCCQTQIRNNPGQRAWGVSPHFSTHNHFQHRNPNWILLLLVPPRGMDGNAGQGQSRALSPAKDVLITSTSPLTRRPVAVVRHSLLIQLTPSSPGDINSAAKASRSCLVNGTWEKNEFGREWSDYTPCSGLKAIKTKFYVQVGAHAVSILGLLPAIAIFMSYKYVIG